jgi:V8-like Glu-specific endopeptidase
MSYKTPMKITMVLLTLIFSLSSIGFSVDPEKAILSYLDIFKAKEQRDGTFKVPTKRYDRSGELSSSSHSEILEKEKYQEFLSLSGAVLEMNRNYDEHRGSAFHIGYNLVLTNNHVLNVEFKNQTKCDGFRLKDHESGKFYNCKTVHFCDPKLDVCLIEMSPLLVKNQWKQLSDGPKLSLKTNFIPSNEEAPTMLMTAIGNSQGLGIHLSQGTSVSLEGTQIVFYAPITGGNSGGPLLDPSNLVVGLIKQESRSIKVGTGAYNIAARMDTVVNLLRANLKDSPEVLEKLNQAVVQ